VKAFAADLREFTAEVERIAFAELEHSPKHFRQLRPCALLRVDLPELLEGLEVVGIEFDDGFKRFGRLVEVRKALDPERRRPEMKRDLRIAIFFDFGALREKLKKLIPPAEALVCARKVPEGTLVLRIEGEDLLRGLHHHRIEAEAIAIERDELFEDLEFALERIVAERVELGAKHFNERVPLISLREELAERLLRARVASIEPLNGFPSVDRALDDSRSLGGLGKADGERELFFGIRHDSLCIAQNGDELPLRIATFVVALVEVEHRAIARIELTEAGKIRLGAFCIAPHPVMDHADLKQDPLLLLEALPASPQI